MPGAAELHRWATELSLDEFVARCPGLVLVTSDNPEGLRAGVTGVVQAVAHGAPMRSTRRYEAFPLGTGPAGRRIAVGRAPDCDLVLHDESVSARHAVLVQLEDGRYELFDLGSRNGTLINSRTVPPNEGKRLRIGDILHFGAVPMLLVDAETFYDLVH